MKSENSLLLMSFVMTQMYQIKQKFLFSQVGPIAHLSDPYCRRSSTAICTATPSFVQIIIWSIVCWMRQPEAPYMHQPSSHMHVLKMAVLHGWQLLDPMLVMTIGNSFRNSKRSSLLIINGMDDSMGWISLPTSTMLHLSYYIGSGNARQLPTSE